MLSNMRKNKLSVFLDSDLHNYVLKCEKINCPILFFLVCLSTSKCKKNNSSNFEYFDSL